MQDRNGTIREQETEASHQRKIQTDQENSNKNQQQILSDKIIKRDQIHIEVDNLEKENRKKDKMLQINKRKEMEAIQERANSEAVKEKIKMDLHLMTRDFENRKRIVDEEKKGIDQKMRERDLLNKDVVLAEDEERKKSGVI